MPSHMISWRVAALGVLALVSLQVGCSGGSGGGSPKPSQVAGSWQGTWVAATPGPAGSLTCSLVQQGTSVTGTVRFEGHPCFADGNVTCKMHGKGMSGWMQAGPTRLAFHGTCSGHDDEVLEGTYEFEAGAGCIGEQGTVHLERIAPGGAGDPPVQGGLPIGDLYLLGPEPGAVRHASVWTIGDGMEPQGPRPSCDPSHVER